VLLSQCTPCLYPTAELCSDGLAYSTMRDAMGLTTAHPTYGHCAMLQDTGEVVRSWGDGQLNMPHGLAVDARSGAVWVTDVGRHQVGSQGSGSNAFGSGSCSGSC
jgi:uncharacterized protein YycO